MSLFSSANEPKSGILSHPAVEAITSNPLNLALFAILLYLLVPILIPTPISRLTPTVDQARLPAGERYSYLPPDHSASTEWKKYTPKSLALHDGTGAGQQQEGRDGDKKGQSILLCINRKVFDVSSGGRFYGPGGPYGNFAGRDASRGMAKQSFDQEMLTPLDKPIDPLTDLTASEKTSMMEWESHFQMKYPIVGELVENGDL
ncbi:unnamed protein product [Sympodiomycopsis kandeliae]